MAAADTIVALASAAGRAGVAVVRVSGAHVPAIAWALLGRLPAPRYATRAAFYDANGQAIDHGLALYFPAPASLTGEHVLELHGHGSPVLIDALLARVMALGARAAAPGEFSQRAFVNDKLSLDQAEAIADAINAGSRAAAAAAMRSLEGAFAREIAALADALVALRVTTEATIDFPDEDDVDFLSDGAIQRRLEAVQAQVVALIAQSRQGVRLSEGLQLVILGRPNVGKSSLLNALARRDTAIVTAIAGTTRDVLSEQLALDGLALTIIDTAGLRQASDPIEAEGVRRAMTAAARADRILLVVADGTDLDGEVRALQADIGTDVPVTLIVNKIDLTGAAPGMGRVAGWPAVRLSAATGAGFDVLARHLKAAVGLDEAFMPAFAARRRHVDALIRAAQALERGHEHLIVDAAGELLAEELRAVHNALAEITGAFTSEDLLGAIFSSFCVGK
jgi:tRNA modification GTPase